MKSRVFFPLLLGALILVSSCNKAEKMNYPVTRKIDQVDNYFGTKVPAPYRWLEDDKSAETAKWVAEQNAVTFAYLDRTPFRETLRKRLTEIYNYPRFSSPSRAGEFYFFNKNDGLQNQSVIYVQKGLDGQPEVFIDPNKLSADGTVRIQLEGVSGNKKYVAISRGEAGSDWSETRVMEIATKKELLDRIRWVKFGGAAWMGNGFFYAGYDKPSAGKELTATNEFEKVFYHQMGDPQEKDQLVFEDKQHPLRYFGIGTTEDEKYGFLTISEGTSGNEVYWKDPRKAAAEFLIKSGYTSKEKLAIAGGSNGGLLVGAAMTQRPDLFRVALPAVGVMDMLRFHKFTVGWGWAVEYGSSDQEKHFKNLYGYSPLHNLKSGVEYPATLVTTADHDDRVVPAHSFKFIATLQEMQKGEQPVLIRIETRSGHGASNVTKAIEQTADSYAFFLKNVGATVK